jgi:hypothetical protein
LAQQFGWRRCIRLPESGGVAAQAPVDLSGFWGHKTRRSAALAEWQNLMA